MPTPPKLAFSRGGAVASGLIVLLCGAAIGMGWFESPVVPLVALAGAFLSAVKFGAFCALTAWVLRRRKGRVAAPTPRAAFGWGALVGFLAASMSICGLLAFGLLSPGPQLALVVALASPLSGGAWALTAWITWQDRPSTG